jgi:hypothetical protein
VQVRGGMIFLSATVELSPIKPLLVTYPERRAQ